jgi:uncharacterized membrane protein YphA (DoxX/SURF4 family)
MLNLSLWIVAALLSAIFFASGAMKLVRAKDQLIAAGQGWVEDFRAGTIKSIGLLEVLAAIGLILPPIVGVARILAPLAALGLVLVMLGAVATHLRRHEHLPILVNSVLLALAALVCWGRFTPAPFTN